MPNRRKPASKVRVIHVADNSWFKNQVTVGNLVSAGVMMFGFAGFYFNTSSAIDAQAKSITSIERRLNDRDKEYEKQQTAVVQERTSLRAEMTTRAEKTAEGIAELNKQTAVLSTQLTTINGELIKLGQQFTNWAATNRK